MPEYFDSKQGYFIDGKSTQPTKKAQPGDSKTALVEIKKSFRDAGARYAKTSNRVEVRKFSLKK